MDLPSAQCRGRQMTSKNTEVSERFDPQVPVVLAGQPGLSRNSASTPVLRQSSSPAFKGGIRPPHSASTPVLRQSSSPAFKEGTQAPIGHPPPAPSAPPHERKSAPAAAPGWPASRPPPAVDRTSATAPGASVASRPLAFPGVVPQKPGSATPPVQHSGDATSPGHQIAKASPALRAATIISMTQPGHASIHVEKPASTTPHGVAAKPATQGTTSSTTQRIVASSSHLNVQKPAGASEVNEIRHANGAGATASPTQVGEAASPSQVEPRQQPKQPAQFGSRIISKVSPSIKARAVAFGGVGEFSHNTGGNRS